MKFGNEKCQLAVGRIIDRNAANYFVTPGYNFLARYPPRLASNVYKWCRHYHTNSTSWFLTQGTRSAMHGNLLVCTCTPDPFWNFATLEAFLSQPYSSALLGFPVVIGLRFSAKLSRVIVSVNAVVFCPSWRGARRSYRAVVSRGSSFQLMLWYFVEVGVVLTAATEQLSPGRHFAFACAILASLQAKGRGST